MRYVIDTNRTGAVSCNYNASCLETGKCGEKEMCAVATDLFENSLLLKTDEPSDCKNRRAIGDSVQVCECPIRAAIYEEYGV